MRSNKAKRNALTQGELKILLDYNPDTGLFIRNKTSGGVLGGSRAGSLNEKGYLVINLNCISYYAHVLAWLYMTGSQSKCYVDHINGDRQDNRWINLREATHSENQRNSKIRKDNKSGFKGVVFNKRHEKWVAHICIDREDADRLGMKGLRKSLGYFDTPQKAHEAYKLAAIKYHGEFANFGDS